jgi:hypothetical protein
LEPISIATQGYVAVTPDDDRCPQPLAIASHGYIVFAADVDDGLGGGTGHGAVVREPRPYVKPKRDVATLAALAIIAIQEYYDE